MPAIPSGVAPRSSQFRTFESFQTELMNPGIFRGAQASFESPEESQPYGQQPYQEPPAFNSTQPLPNRPAEPQPPGSSLFDPTQGSLIGGLSAPVTGSVQDAASDLEALREKFMQEAGGPRSFTDVGGLGTITSALQPSAGEDALAAAKQLVGASYEGPMALDEAGRAEAERQLKQAGQQARALGTGSGVQAILQGGIPSLTPGEAAFEAQNLLQKEEARRAAVALEAEARAGLSNLYETEGRLKGYADERTAQEKAIAETARGQLQGARQDIITQVDAEVAKRQAEQEAARKAYEDIIAQGDYNLLPQDLQGSLNTPGRQAAQEAQAIYDQIIAEFDDIKAYGLLEPIVTHRGKQWYAYKDPVTGKLVDIRKMKDLPKSVEKRLVERQRRLEAALGQRIPDLTKRPEDRPELAHIAPVHFLGGQGFEESIYKPEDFRPFLSLDAGNQAVRQNTASTDQIAILNNISSIFDEADRMAAAGDPFRAAKMAVDADGYLQSEIARLEERKDAMTAAEKAYLRKVKKTRDRYKDSIKNHHFWGGLASAVEPVPGSGVVTGGLDFSTRTPGGNAVGGRFM